MDGLVLLVKSRAQITVETVDLVTYSLVIASFVLWGILVTRALISVVNIVTQLKCVTKKMEPAKTARPVEGGHIVQKCATSNAKIQHVSEMSHVYMDVMTGFLVQNVQTNVILKSQIVPNAKVSMMKSFVNVVPIPHI